MIVFTVEPVPALLPPRNASIVSLPEYDAFFSCFFRQRWSTTLVKEMGVRDPIRKPRAGRFEFLNPLSDLMYI